MRLGHKIDREFLDRIQVVTTDELPFRATCGSLDSDTYWVVLILRIGEIIAGYVLIAVFDRFAFHCVYETKGNLIDGEKISLSNRDVIDGQVCESVVGTRYIPCKAEQLVYGSHTREQRASSSSLIIFLERDLRDTCCYRGPSSEFFITLWNNVSISGDSKWY